MPLYFAYGSNMDRAAMRARCPGSRMLGPARLARHRLVITPEGYASVMRDPRREVHGLLWDLDLADMPALDRYEGAAGRLYAKVIQGVITDRGMRRALLYVGRGEGGRPRPGYLEAVAAAAASAGLPAAYVAGLHRLTAKGPGLRPEGEARTPAGLRAGVRPTRASPADPPPAPAPRSWEP